MNKPIRRIAAPQLFLSLILLLLAFQSRSQSGVSGTIKDKNGNGIPGVTVRVGSSEKGTTSTADGSYRIDDLRPGTFELRFSSVGFENRLETISLKKGQVLRLDIVLPESARELGEVKVFGKGEAQQLRESSYTVNAIDTRAFANTTSDLNQVLNYTTGVRIREQGGLGSQFNFSINGLSGKAVKYFIDGVPLELFGTAVSLNNIPVNLAERIELYKGVVPVQLGSDAMGGAVNIITSRQQQSYLDVSHSFGSFNTHRSAVSGQYVHKPSGLTVKVSGFYNYSDNNYRMKGVEILEGGERKGDQITDLTGASFVTADVRRFHDQYQSVMGQAEIGVTGKRWADVFSVGASYSRSLQDLQTGFEQTIVYGNVTRKADTPSALLRYKKENLFAKGLDFNLFASLSKDTYITADTLFRQYYWDGAWTAKGASEMSSSIRSVNHIVRPRNFVRANLSYQLSELHSFNINYTRDQVRNEIYNKLVSDGDDMPGTMSKQVLGLAYQQDFLDKRLTNSFFVKYYGLGLLRNKWVDLSYQSFRSNFSNYGYGLASRYKVLPDLGIKLSLERSYRLQEVEEVYGDGLNLQPNPDLNPENSYNANLGAFYGYRASLHRFFIEAGGFYRDASDFIYVVPDQRSKALKYENKSSVRVSGFEAELRYDYADFLTFNINATYQNAVNMTKFGSTASTTYEATYRNKIPNQPWLFGNANLGIGKNNVGGTGNRLQFNWFTQYVHWFYLTWEAFGNVNGKSNIPTQLIHNATLSYSFKDGRYNVSAESRNLTDALAYDNFRQQKPGRAFSVKVRYFLR